MNPVPTPCYVYDLDRLRHAHDRLVSALPEPSALFYSLKANAHPAVIARLAGLGCRAEVSSPGELSAALAAGAPADGILYSGPGKRDDDVRSAVALGVRLFSVDSPVALDQLDRAGRSAGVRLRALLRINQPDPPDGAGTVMTGGTSKFGTDLDRVVSAPDEFADRPHATVHGLHIYQGSNLRTEDDLCTVAEHALEAATAARDALGCEPALFDLGGGFGAPYARPGSLPEFPDLRGRLTRLLDRSVPHWREGAPHIAFESGRYLTSTCGTLLTTVLDVKRSAGRRIVVLDAGVNHLGGMPALGREPSIEPDVAGTGRERTPGWTLCGPLLHPLDVWVRETDLPEPRVGDRFAIPNVGAYGLCASLALYHAHPLPWEIVVDDGREIGRSRLTLTREQA